MTGPGTKRDGYIGRNWEMRFSPDLTEGKFRFFFQVGRFKLPISRWKHLPQDTAGKPLVTFTYEDSEPVTPNTDFGI